ncbi:hypothetical protein B9479_001615 [Cryptococcus floricola]|uniref:Uncharacterized protein n=1 Tax=Cryptococcus floricola TaxID=2591691 RepID=A0A5D3B5D1_9TREE|nr:hypothetical protein B9479_001615 [Cryptococcus floricola]
MITYAPKTFSLKRLTGLCRQNLVSNGLSTTAPSRAVAPMARNLADDMDKSGRTVITINTRPQWTEARIRNKIERARMAELRRHGLA